MNKLIINSIVTASLAVNPALVAFAQDTSLTGQAATPTPVRAVPDRTGDQLRIFQERALEQREALREKAAEEREAAVELFRATTTDRREAAQDLQTTLQRTAQDKRELLKRQIEERRDLIEEKRENFRASAEDAREEARQKREEQREELRARLENIRDERKKEAVERLANRFTEINEKLTNHWLAALVRLEELLAKVGSRADKAEVNGADVAATRAAIDEAEAAISSARMALEAQLAKTYPIGVTTEDALRSAVAEARDALNNDLQAVKESVRTAHKAVVDALTSLKGIPDVDQFNGDDNGDENGEGEDDETATTTE